MTHEADLACTLTISIGARLCHFMTDGLSEASYAPTRNVGVIAYVLKRPAVLVGSA